MRAAFLLVLLVFQDDPFAALSDASRRADQKARKAAAEALGARAKESTLAWAGAKFLAKTDREWGLAGAPAADLQAVLAKYVPALSEAQHREALQSLLAGLEKHAKSDAAEAFRLFAFAHASALGDKAPEAMAKLGFVKEGDRWGKKEQLTHYALARIFIKPGYVPAEAEKAARASPSFAPRYAAALLDVQKAFSANAGYESASKALAGLAGAGAPPGAAEHLKALAQSVKSAVYCSNSCANGRVTCERCLGKKKRDVVCDNCKGLGWAQKGGANANTLIRCWRCPGTGIFKNAGCPDCKQTGQVECGLCGGKPWRDGFKGCRDCKMCGTCKGRRQTQNPCATCGGKGRVPPVVAGIPTTLCNDCKGNAVIRALCKDCGESGLADCGACGGKGARDGKSRAKAADVYTPESCGACGGAGWPLPNLAVPCDRCLGLGCRFKPKGDPSKMLD